MRLFLTTLALGLFLSRGASSADHTPDQELVKAVTEYLDQLVAMRNGPATVEQPRLSKLSRRFDWIHVAPELFRQAKARDSDFIYGEIIRASQEYPYEFIREPAMRGLAAR